MIKSKLGFGSISLSPEKCVDEALRDITSPKILIFFSPEKDFCDYARLIHRRFPEAVSIGCSTYRTWDPEKTAKDRLVVAAIEEGVSCSAGVIEKADSFALEYSDNVRNCMNEIEPENTICIELTVPFRRCEAFSLMALNSVLLRHDIPIVGGTASNLSAGKNESEEAYVALNGHIYPEGCVFAMIHNEGGRIILRHENIYCPLTGNRLKVTKANDLTRTILTYDDQPAADVYARELGVPPEDISKYFFHYPMGRCVGPMVFVTAIHEECSNGSLRFHARVHEGTEMMVMKEGDYKAATLETIESAKKEIENPSLAIMFHCVARTVLYESNGYLEEYQKAMSEAFPNFIGLACLGEQQATRNFNHTMLLAIFE